MDFFKNVIKHKKIPVRYKFNALLLLKDLMKSKVPALVEYCEKTILRRLFLISKKENPEECLPINFHEDKEWIGHFHELNLETLGIWGETFKETYPEFFIVAKKLSQIGRLPVNEKYFRFPSADEAVALRKRYHGAGEIKRPVSDQDRGNQEGPPGNDQSSQV